ncbi:uncharacterized protein LOC115321114 [Ixodes scapularis]|uniref:uncharacterized protein LOC115321114 n=1 Tax=Ixodes scapularis TaxID=6945 RepID=UPI001C394A43|nr:uncharacterized protein LOC115321114 [Ixodes scapularis]
MNAFTGHMKATMMIRPEPERIDSMKALSAHPNMRTLIWKGTAYEALLKNSKDVEEYQAVWKMVERCNGTYETNSLYSMNHLRSVLSGEAVIVSDVTTMRYHVSRTCHLFRDANYYFAKEQFFPHKFAIALRNGTDSRFTEFMNKRINWVVESGLLQAWMNREYGDWAACSAANHEEVYTPLSIFEVQSIFLLYLMFTAISVAAFLLEVASKGKVECIKKPGRVVKINITTDSLTQGEEKTPTFKGTNFGPRLDGQNKNATRALRQVRIF